MRLSTPGALPVLVLVACGLGSPDSPGGASEVGTGIGPRDEGPRPGATAGPGEQGTTGPASGSDGASGGESPSETSGPGLDLGATPEFEGPPAGCTERKVDFLFIVSRYFTMGTVLPVYLSAVSAFFETIEDRFAGYDRHILFANPDSDWGNWCCDGNCEGQVFDVECIDGVCAGVPGYPCGAVEDTTACDWTAGAGIVFPAGEHASNYPCPLVGGRRYIVEEHPEKAAAFECLAHVGLDGPLPQLGDALVAALSPEMNGPQGCNAGFLRDDAALVVVMISGTGSHDDVLAAPQDWYEALVATRHGDLRSVAVLGIVSDNGLPAAACPGGYKTYATLWEFLDMMAPRSVFQSACDPAWGEAFATTVELVLEACTDAPPG